MTAEEKRMGEANKYVMPAVDDYLATRCLLLNSIFVGLVIAHESVEKLLKGLLIIEEVKFPKRCHEVTTLSGLLYKKDKIKYKFLGVRARKHFIRHLDQNYAWRYYDGDNNKRSKNRGTNELHPIDDLWFLLYSCYLEFIPEKWRGANYVSAYIFAPNMLAHLNWSEILTTDNRAFKKKHGWKEEFDKWYYKT